MKLKGKSIQIACDGGAATGKSTGGKMLAKKYKLKFLSSGLLYRYSSFLLLKHKPKNKIQFLKKKFNKLNHKKLEKINLHTPEISKNSAFIAKQKKVREILKKFQKKFAVKYKRVCIEGRDISTNILPNSDLKFYFKCSLNISSSRRYLELKEKNPDIKLLDVKKALRLRNIQDRKRKNSPLLKHRDSIEIDTGKIGKRSMLKKMSKHYEKMLLKKYGN